jgi:DNA topoisomerase-3
MHVILNVAEKPSVARAITESLSGGNASKRNGKSQFNPIHEFQYNLRGRNCKMLVTSVSGHLLDMDFPKPYNKLWHKCSPIELFDMEIETTVHERSVDIVKTLQDESKRAHELILWLDCDREGENIAFEVLDVCKKSNSRLDIWRAQFSDISKSYV